MAAVYTSIQIKRMLYIYISIQLIGLESVEKMLFGLIPQLVAVHLTDP